MNTLYTESEIKSYVIWTLCKHYKFNLNKLYGILINILVKITSSLWLMIIRCKIKRIRIIHLLPRWLAPKIFANIKFLLRLPAMSATYYTAQMNKECFFFFFFSMKSNARRGAPEWSSPYEYRKILALLKRRESWSSERVEAWVFVNPGFEGLKIVSARKDGGREGVPVSWSHRDKRISEWSGSALF